MQYLRVRFVDHAMRAVRTKRDVRVNGEPFGKTSDLLRLPEGTHTISLAPPDDHSPRSKTIVLRDTSPLAPAEVTFVRG